MLSSWTQRYLPEFPLLVSIGTHNRRRGWRNILRQRPRVGYVVPEYLGSNFVSNAGYSLWPCSEPLLETRCSTSISSIIHGHSVWAVAATYPAFQASSVRYTIFNSLLSYSHIISHRIPAPSESKEAEKSSAPVEASKSEPVDLTTAITEVTSANKVYSAAKLPPRLPSPFKRWHPELAPDAPHDPNAYFPMVLYK